MPIDQEDIHKHLDFIQLTITRMGANSFLIKGWSVTLVAGLLAFTTDKDKTTAGALVGLMPALLFWGLDAYYLRQERLFRKLYDVVRKQDTTDYSLDIKDIPRSERKQVPNWFATLFAIVNWPFYLSLIGVIAFVWQFNVSPSKVDLVKPSPGPQLVRGENRSDE